MRKISAFLGFFFLLFMDLYSLPEKEEKEIRDIVLKKYGFRISREEGDRFFLFKLVLKWEGVPFLLGGNTKTGIGPSELVTELSEKVYFRSLSGSPSTMFRKVKLRKMGENPEQGDLVFFKNKKDDVIHVGMYLKDKYFIHVNVKTGVIVENLNDSPYSSTFYAFGKIRNCGD